MARRARLERHAPGSDARTRERLGVARRTRRHALDAPRHRSAVHRAAAATATGCYGRGACDAKGIAAAMLVAADRLADAGEERVDLLFVVGEEKGSDGARAANHLAATSKFLVNGEPTESKLASGAKGSLRVTVRTRGRAAHSAYAHLGESAIEPMLELLPTLESARPADRRRARRHDGQHRHAARRHRGQHRSGARRGRAHVPPRRRRRRRCARRSTQWAKGRAELEYGSYIPAQHFHTIPGFEVAPVAYTSDIPLLGRWGTPLLFGPGSIHVAHTPDEFIDVEELRAAVDAYETYRAELCSRHERTRSRHRAPRTRRRPRRHRRRRPGVHSAARRIIRGSSSPSSPRRSVRPGRPYAKRRAGSARDAMPARVADMIVLPCDPDSVSAPTSCSRRSTRRVAGDAEPAFARAGKIVLTQREELPHGSGRAARDRRGEPAITSACSTAQRTNRGWTGAHRRERELRVDRRGAAARADP